MIGSRRAWRSFVAIALGLIGTGMADVRSPGQEQAASLSAGFRRATARVKRAIVSVRGLDGMRPPATYVPPRIGRIGPGMVMPPGGGRMVDGEGPASWTGVVIDADRGYILTIDRPSQGASQLLVTFPDGAERLTMEVRRDPGSDLALLIVDIRGLRLEQAGWGDPDKLEPGDWLIALGQPGVGAPTMSAGIFSARRRGVGEELIETDARIPRLGAGGALVNLSGEVIGISKLGGRRGEGVEGMSHAVPADRARRVAADLAQFGRLRRGYLGVQVDPVDPATAGRRDYPPGVRVASVGADSPAAEAGVRPGDLILAAGRRPIDGVAALQQAIELAAVGDPLKLTLERKGQTLEVTVRPRVMSAPMGPGRPARPDPLVETRRDAAPGRTTAPDSPPIRPTTPDRPATPDGPVPPDPSPPRPDGPTSPPPLESPGSQSVPPGR